MASPAFIAAGAELEVNSGSGAYTGNVAVPAGVADGDFLLLVVRNTRADATIATPSGWTSITAHEKTSITQSDLRLFRRDASSEPSTYTISNDGAGNGVNAFSAQILAWGPSTLETSATWESTSTSTTVACPAVTSGGADRTLICVYGQYGNVQGSISYTPPSGMTERTDQNFVDSVANNTSFSVADLAISSSGSTGTKNATASDGTPWHLAVSLLLQSAGSPAPTLTANQGSYSITGQTSTSLKVARVLPAAQGSYSLSGQAATLTYEQPGVTIMPAAYGTYSITGSDGLAQRAMNAVYGTYAINGRNASLRGPGDVLLGNTQKTLSMAMSMGL